MNKHLVFVYGTLRRDGENAMSVRFPDAKFVGDAKVNGSLYDFGAYPGLIADETGSLVVGEAYEVDDETLNRLDEFEALSNYLRKEVEISVGNDKKLCWTYEPNPAVYSLRTLITSGDWIECVKMKTDLSEDKSPDETQG